MKNLPELSLALLDEASGGAFLGQFYAYDYEGARRLAIYPEPSAWAVSTGTSVLDYGQRAREIAEQAASQYFASNAGSHVFTEVERRDETGALLGTYSFGNGRTPFAEDAVPGFLQPAFDRVVAARNDLSTMFERGVAPTDPAFEQAMVAQTQADDLLRDVRDTATAVDGEIYGFEIE